MANLPVTGIDPESMRISALDGLRGLAAASVVMLHLFSVFLDTSFAEYDSFDRLIKWLTHTPFEIFWGGAQAVPLFFILSGFALHRMLSGQRMNYCSYAARRVIRLWVPYVAVLAIASVGIYFGGSHTISGQSVWMNSHLGTTLSEEMLVDHVLMLGVFDTRPIDFVVWSLVLELRVSLLFPAIYWAVERFRARDVLGFSLAVSLAASYYQSRTGGSSVSVVATLGCQAYFVVGAVMSRHVEELRRVYLGLPIAVKATAFAIAIVLYCNCLSISSTYSPMLGATILFAFALCSSAIQAALSRPVVRWLGKISYSLYLSHGVVLLLMINLFYPRVSFVEIVLICAPVSFLVATGLYSFVELPAIEFSRVMGRRLQSRCAWTVR
jgi:peptidoglycan/LPS O-acetylase OafA/YrhL